MKVPTIKRQTNGKYIILFGAVLLGLSLGAAIATRTGVELAKVVVSPLSFIALCYYFHKALKAEILSHPSLASAENTTWAFVGCSGLCLGLFLILPEEVIHPANALLSIGLAFSVFFPFILLEALKNIPRQLSTWQYTLSMALPIVVVTVGLICTVRPEVSGAAVANMGLFSSACLVASGIYLNRAKPWGKG